MSLCASDRESIPVAHRALLMVRVLFVRFPLAIGSGMSWMLLVIVTGSVSAQQPSTTASRLQQVHARASHQQPAFQTTGELQLEQLYNRQMGPAGGMGYKYAQEENRRRERVAERAMMLPKIDSFNVRQNGFKYVERWHRNQEVWTLPEKRSLQRYYFDQDNNAVIDPRIRLGISFKTLTTVR